LQPSKINKEEIKMAVTSLDVFRELARMGITSIGLKRIDEVLTQVDHEAIVQKHRERFTYEVWDKKTPINGVPAEVILSRDDVQEDGEIYLLYKDGVLTHIQPHVPHEVGFKKMDKDTVHEHAKRHAEHYAQHHADEEIIEECLKTLLAEGV
jgi:hypothetical protein